MPVELLVPIAVFASVLVWGGLAKWRAMAVANRRIEEARRSNEELQRFLIDRMESIKQLLADPELPLAELKTRTEALMAEIENRNVNGDLDALIADNAAYLSEEFVKRSSL